MQIALRNWPLPVKLLIITIVPVIFIIYLTAELYVEKSRNVAQIEKYLQNIKQSATMTRLIDALQKERKLSFDFVVLKQGENELQAQRASTDFVFSQLKDSQDKALENFTQYTFLEKLDSIRAMIDSGRTGHSQVLFYYSGTIFRLNTLNRPPTLLNEFLTDVYDQMTAQRLLSELITYQGIINMNFYHVLHTRTYMAETLMGTLGTYDVYKTYEKELQVKANPEILNEVNKLKKNSAYQQVNNYLAQTFGSFKFDSSYTKDSWNEVSMNSLNELRSLQMKLLTRVEQKMNAYYLEEKAEKSATFFSVIAIIVLLVAVVVLILTSINQSLGQLKYAALQLAGGATGLQLKSVSNDAIGSLATSICKIDDKNKELALAAQQIGENNFAVSIVPRSKEDVLGNAIVQMKENLQRSTADLEKSREEFIKLADFMPQIVWTAQPNGSTDYFNKKWYEITGAKEGTGDQSWVGVLHPDDVGRCLNTWYNCVKTGDDYNIEYRLKNISNNEYRWYLGRALPITDNAGKLVKWFGTTTDIHDQKKQNEKLEQEVAQRTLELTRSNEDLQQFAHVASHDLKEPLRKITTFSQRLELEFGTTLPEKGKMYMKKLQASSQRMVNMIESILSYSVMNATELVKEKVDLNRVLEGIMYDLELLILQKEAKIVFGNLPKINAVPVHINQLFYNLINNALKFSKDDVPAEIKITAAKATPEEVENQEDLVNGISYLHLTISDNGIGFNDDYVDKIFNVFSRLNSKEKYEGTGLGLALCKKIVHRHNGTIYAKGEEGVGATFHIFLPEH